MPLSMFKIDVQYIRMHMLDTANALLNTSTAAYLLVLPGESLLEAQGP